MTTTAIELPSYLRLPPSAVCAGCGQSALAECRDDLLQHNHWLCTLCKDKGTPPTPMEVGRTAGHAIGAMFYAAKDLLIELSEAIEQVVRPEQPTAETNAVAVHAANVLAAPAPLDEDPLGPRVLLTTAHGESLVDLTAHLAEQIEQLLTLSSGATPLTRRRP